MKTGFSKKPKILEKIFKNFLLFMLRQLITHLFLDFSVRQKKIISNNWKMDIFKMSKNVQNRNLMGSLKRGVKMFLMRSINIKNMTFYNYPLQRCRKKRWKPRLKMTFFGHFYEFWLTIWLIRLMRRFEFAPRNVFAKDFLTKISKKILKTFNNLGAA